MNFSMLLTERTVKNGLIFIYAVHVRHNRFSVRLLFQWRTLDRVWPLLSIVWTQIIKDIMLPKHSKFYNIASLPRRPNQACVYNNVT